GSIPSDRHTPNAHGMSASPQKRTSERLPRYVRTDPVAFGLVASHARPGANVTGILATLDTLPEKQLALAAEVIRGAVKMGMLINAGFQAHAIMRQGTERAAAALAITLVPAEVRLPDDLDAAFHSLARERVEAVLVLQDPMSLAE